MQQATANHETPVTADAIQDLVRGMLIFVGILCFIAIGIGRELHKIADLIRKITEREKPGGDK